MKRLIFPLLALLAAVLFLPFTSYAQTAIVPTPSVLQVSCIPPLVASDPTKHDYVGYFAGSSKNGVWVWWYCPNADGTLTRVSYVSTMKDLAKQGARIKTILSAPDPLKSLNEAGKRFLILPLSDPSLDAVVADMLAAQAAMQR